MDPTTPEFRTEEGFYLVEGNVIVDGETRVVLQRSDFDDAVLDLLPVTGARVFLVSPDDGGSEEEFQHLGEGVYRPGGDFTPAVGDRFFLRVIFPDGTQVTSATEVVPAAVPLLDARLRVNERSFFDEGRDRFLPAHELFADYADPAGVENYYAYAFRYWEQAPICITCFRGIFRDGACSPPVTTRFAPTYDYLCDSSACYQITEGMLTTYVTDELTDGVTVSGVRFGRAEFDEYGGLLAEARLLSISRDAYEYGRVIQDLRDGSTGLNATIPAALIGNLTAAEIGSREVLGFFGAANLSTRRAFTDRTEEDGTPSRPQRLFNFEPPPSPVEQAPRAPCDVPGRTSEQPAGWGG